jgi:putative spermidine/putrescine transport system substrate-binding protein
MGWLSLGLAACQASGSKELRLTILKQSIPAQLAQEFSAWLEDYGNPPVQLQLKTQAQLVELFQALQNWKRQTTGQIPPPQPWLRLPWGQPTTAQPLRPPDLMSLGDYWLSLAIRQKLIQPLSGLDWKLDDRWKQLVRRNPQGLLDPNGALWAAPYRWGATVIAYRKDVFAQRQLPPPTDWADLWRPDLKGQISLPDQPRQVIGLVLKRLGHSYNTENLQAVPDLVAQLQQLHRQTKFYSSRAYLQPLMLKDTWVAVGSSSDLLPSLRTQSDLAVVFPRSGTDLWADVWVRPATPTDEDNPIINQWITFCWTDPIAYQVARLTYAGSPLPHSGSPSAQEVPANPLLQISPQQWAASEFLLPLPPATVTQYRSLWQSLRR